MYAFNDAIALLNEAQKVLPETAGAATRFQLWRMMGVACGCSSRLDDAIGAYARALEHAEDRIARATAELGIGENYHRKGQFEEALRHLDVALKEVGFPRPLASRGRSSARSCAALYVHCLPRWSAPSGGGPDRDRRLDIGVAANDQCLQMLAPRNVLKYTYASYRAAALALQTGRPEDAAVAHSKFAINWGLFGLHSLGRIYSRAALKAVESRPRDVIWARTIAQVGTAHYFAGRLDEGEAALSESVALLDRVSDYYGNYTHHFLRHIHGVRCDIPREIAEAEAEIAYGELRGDGEILAWGYYGKANALARAGRTDEALGLAVRSVELLRPRSSLTEALAHQVLGIVRLLASEYAAARAAFEESARLIKANLFLVEFTADTYPFLVESLLGPRWAEPDGGPGRSVAVRAWRESRFARHIGWRFPNYGSRALRVSGRAASALGRPKRAPGYFERSITAAEKIGARYDLARAWLDTSLVISEKADDYRRRGRLLLDDLGAVVPEAERLLRPD